MATDSIIQPLDSEEIKSGLVTKVAEAMWEALDKTCSLYGVAYAKFSAKGSIECVFDNFGLEAQDRIQFSVAVDIPFTPPNVFRKETGQKKPENVLKPDDGVQQKAVVFQRTKRGAKKYDD